jgi:CDP-diacylglycerol--glycerol-3-phosphate 3-phosphatidyltransferase
VNEGADVDEPSVDIVTGKRRRIGPVPLVNPANAITTLRLVLVPVFMALVIASKMTEPSLRIAACVAFFVAGLTDLLDGWIARTWDMVTAFGKVADPIADKALTGSAFILLSWYGKVPWWITVAILGRELGVTLLRFWVIRHGVIAASRGGKAKTALQSLAIVWTLWPFTDTLEDVGPFLVYGALIITVLTGADYVMRALRLRRAGTQTS